MTIKKGLLLAVAVVIAAFAVWLGEHQRALRSDGAMNGHALVFPGFTDKDIDELLIESPGGKYRLVRQGPLWVLPELNSEEASPKRVSSMLESLRKMRIGSIISANESPGEECYRGTARR